MFLVLSFCVYYQIKSRSSLGDVPSIVCLTLMVLIILLTIPIGGLTGFHLLLIIRGRTTNEQVTGKFKSNLNPVRASPSTSVTATLRPLSLSSSLTTACCSIVSASSPRQDIPGSQVASRLFASSDVLLSD